MPMSWNSGSQDTITSPPGRAARPRTIASMLACRLRWVIRTAFGLGGRAAGELQQRGVVLAGDARVRLDAGSPSRSPSRRYGMPRPASTGARPSNGAPSSTNSAPIIFSTRDGLLGPRAEVGARGGLVQHRDAAADQPDRLRRPGRSRPARRPARRRRCPGRRRPRPSAPASRRAAAWISGQVRRTARARLPGGHAVRRSGGGGQQRGEEPGHAREPTSPRSSRAARDQLRCPVTAGTRRARVART